MMPSDDSEALQIGPDPDKLYLYHRQQLSAMLDGELSPDQARFMLRRLQHDVELASCWERWQVCGDVMRGQRNALLPADFAEGVAREIAGGDRALQPVAATAGRPRLWRWGGGAALAASVAVAALFVGRGQLQAPDGLPAADMPALALESSSAPASAPISAATPAPADSGVAEAALAAAGTALAVAEVPRRGDERRTRGQAQRAAVTRGQRRAGQAPVAVAAADSATPAAATRPALPVAQPATVVLATTDSAAAGPFVPAEPVPSRPWPRAVLPGATGASLAVGYGEAGSGSAAFHPFQPQLAAQPAWSGLAPATAIGSAALSGAAVDSAAPSPDPR